MASDTTRYKEIGELSTNSESALVGNVKSSSFKNKSLLSPDSDRLLYNYSKEVDVKDSAVAEASGEYGKRIIFVGCDILTIYDVEKGNFWLENPRKILEPLMKGWGEGGLDLTGTDIAAVSANMTYVSVVDQDAYIVSQAAGGTNVLFKINMYTYEVSQVCKGFDVTLGDAMLYSKPFVFNARIHFIAKVENAAKVYAFNTANSDWSEQTELSNLIADYYVAGVRDKNTIVAVKDESLNRIYFIAATAESSVKVYNYSTAQSGVLSVTDGNLGLSGTSIKQINVFEDADSRTSQTYISILSSNNVITFLSFTNRDDTGLVMTKLKYKFVSSYGVIGYAKVILGTGDYGFYVFVKTSDGKTTALYYPMSDITSDKTIDVATTLIDNKTPAFLKSLSDNINITKNLFSADDLNLIIGNYLEAGNTMPLIKDFGITTRTFGSEELDIQNRMFRTILDKESGVSLVKGLPYSETQMSRVRLFPETILTSSSVHVSDDTVVSLKESLSDKTNYTTGKYIWKTLNELGLPYNTHVETIGRIIVNGYDIPVENTLITKAAAGEEYGDVLFTIDKLFDISLIKNALSENTALYPGVLFFKNNGFLNSAVISNSYAFDNSITYDDADGEKLFDTSVFEITCSCRVGDNILLLGTNTGAIASVNIQTGGYTSSSGNSNGDNPPPYYRAASVFADRGALIGLIVYKDSIFGICNSGAIIKTSIGVNSWSEAKPNETNGDAFIQKAYDVKDNLIICSMLNGGIFSFDMDTGSYIEQNANGTYAVNGTIQNVASTQAITAKQCSQVILGNRLYFLPTVTGSGYDENYLYWYDFVTNTIGHTTNAIPTANAGGMLVTDGTDIYIISGSSASTLFTKYVIDADRYDTLAALPVSDISFNGAYYNNGKVYVPFGYISGSKYIFEYSVATDKWVTYLPTNQESIPNMVEANNYTYINGNNHKIFRMFNGKLKGATVANASNLVSSYIDIDLTIADITGSVTVVNTDATEGTFGSTACYDQTNKRLYVVGGKTYDASGVKGDAKLAAYATSDDGQLSLEGEFDMVANSNAVAGLYGDSLIAFGGSVSSKVKMFDTRKMEWSDVNFIAHYGSVAGEHISAMKVIGDKDMLVISYSDGSIGSIDLRTGEFIPQHTSAARIRCVHRIFADANEVSDEGATRIDEVGDDVIFNTPSRTFRWSTLIGAFFTHDDRRFLEKYNNCNLAEYQFDASKMITKKPVAGSSKVVVGKYIIFMNGYDSDSPTAPTENVKRSVVAYDTELHEFALIAEGLNTTDVDGTVLRKFNAFSHYFNGSIYTFGGIYRHDEKPYDETNGTYTVTTNKRTGSIERYDLVTGKITLLDNAVYGYDTPVASIHTVGQNASDNSYNRNPVLSTIGLNETRCLTPCSQKALFTGDSADTEIEPKRYLAGFVTPGEADKSSITVIKNTGSDSNDDTTTESFGTLAFCVFDTYTETVKNYRTDLPSINSEAVVIPVERICNGSVTEYLFVYEENTISVYTVSVGSSGLTFTLLSSTFTDDASAGDLRKGINVPFYDDGSDRIVFPDLLCGNGMLRTIVFECDKAKFNIFKESTTDNFSPDNGTNALHRVLPHLVTSKNKLVRFDDIKYMFKTLDKHEFTSIKENYSANHPGKNALIDAFKAGVRDNASVTNYPENSLPLKREIVRVGDEFYKVLFIYKSNTRYDSIEEFGTAGKTRVVILKLDNITGEISVPTVYYPESGAWSAIGTRSVVKTFVSDGIVWFWPKLNVAANESNIPGAKTIFSYNPDDDTVAMHDVGDADNTELILETTSASCVIVNSEKSEAAVAYPRYYAKDDRVSARTMWLSGLTKVAHETSAAIDVPYYTMWVDAEEEVSFPERLSLGGYFEGDIIKLFAVCGNKLYAATVDASDDTYDLENVELGYKNGEEEFFGIEYVDDNKLIVNMYNPSFDEEADKYQILDNDLRFKDELCFGRTLSATLLPYEGSVIRSFAYDGTDHILSTSYISEYDAISCLTNVKKFHEVEALYGKPIDMVVKSDNPTKYCYIVTNGANYKYFFESGIVEITSDEVDLAETTSYTPSEQENILEGLPDNEHRTTNGWWIDDGNTIYAFCEGSGDIHVMTLDLPQKTVEKSNKGSESDLFNFASDCFAVFGKMKNIFTFDSDFYCVHDGQLYKHVGNTYNRITDIAVDATGKEVAVGCDVNGVITAVFASCVDSETIQFKISKFDISLGAIVYNKSIDVSGFTMNNIFESSNWNDFISSSKTALFAGNKVVFALGVTDNTKTVYGVKLDLVTELGFATTVDGLKDENAIQYFNGDIVAFGGRDSSVRSITATKRLINSTVTRSITETIPGTGSFGVPLIKSGHRLFGVFPTEDNYSLFELDKCNKSLYESGLKTKQLVNTDFGIKGTINSYPQSSDELAFGPLTDDEYFISMKLINSEEGGDYRGSFKPIKSPVTEFVYNDTCGIKIYTGLTSDLFVSYDLGTGEVVSAVTTERGYGYSISTISASEDSILVFYENSPNISALIVHDDGELTVKLFNGKVCGKQISSDDNTCTVQELDLTLLFDEESSELAIRGN